MPQSKAKISLGTTVVHRSNKQPSPIVDRIECENSLLLVFECIRELTELDIPPTRELIHQKTGLPLTTVDDRVKVLRGEGMISAQQQCYKPTVRHAPTQPISATIIGDGSVKIEKGDVVMELTPAEARNIGKLLMGSANESCAMTSMSAFMDVLATTSTEFFALRNVTRKHAKRIESAQQSLQLEP